MWYEIPGFNGWYAVNEKQEFRTVKRPIKVSSRGRITVDLPNGVRTSKHAYEFYVVAMKAGKVWDRFPRHKISSEEDGVLTVLLSGRTEFQIDREDWQMFKDSLVHGEPFYDDSRGYVQVSIIGHRKNVGIHTIICPAPEGRITDHIDRNKLNNSRKNLRVVTYQENTFNRDVSGVSFQKGSWVARITVDGYSHYLGDYIRKEHALAARAKAEKEYFGEFAATNKTNK